MPTYGKKKIKDMVKGVLPSTARKRAKDVKDQIHRETRRTTRQEVAEMVKDPEAYEEYTPEDKDYDHRISYAVQDRRAADKVGSLMKWAPKVTKGRHDKRIAQLRQMLPKGTIGEHALGHVRYLDPFTNPNDPYKIGRYARKPRKYVHPDVTRKLWLEDMMRERPYLHGPLNAALKYAHSSHRVVEKMVKSPTGHEYPIYKVVGPKRARTLRGLDDIENFLKDLADAARYRYKNDDGAYHPEWTGALDKFIAKNPSVSI